MDPISFGIFASTFGLNQLYHRSRTFSSICHKLFGFQSRKATGFIPEPTTQQKPHYVTFGELDDEYVEYWF